MAARARRMRFTPQSSPLCSRSWMVCLVEGLLSLSHRRIVPTPSIPLCADLGDSIASYFLVFQTLKRVRTY